MNLTFFETGFFPFCVPEKDASFAASVGPGTVYPAGGSLDQALQLYWRAQTYQLIAAGASAYGGLSQTLAINGAFALRNAAAGTSSYGPLTGFAPAGPQDLVCGRGVQQVVPGTGTITASGDAGSGSSPALFNLQVNLFYPLNLAADPLVKYAGLWWPAMSVSCQVTNTVALTGGGSLSLEYDCTSVPNAETTTEVGTFSFLGATLPIYALPLAPASGSTPAETQTFSGSLAVAAEWP